jgi:hypothetical protein
MTMKTMLVALAAVVLLVSAVSAQIPGELNCDELLYHGDGVRTCGAFGDPHIILFNGTGVNCGYDEEVLLIDNQYFSISATAEFVSGSSGNVSSSVTAFTSITFTYKSACNPWSLTFNQSSMLNETSINSPTAGRHGVRVQRNNVFIDAIHLRFQVRMSAGTLVFGLSIPNTLIESSTGVCSDSCPGKEISFDNPPLAPVPVTNSGRDMANVIRAAKFAAGVCEEAGLVPGTFEYQACEFDVGLTGNPGIAQASSSFQTVNSEVSTAWEAPAEPSSEPQTSEPHSAEPHSAEPHSAEPHSSEPHSDEPTGTPSGTPSGNPTGTPSGSPTTNAPSSASALAPSAFVVVVLASLLFF